MKAEICAETTARIAYAVRLMLDDVKDEIRAALDPRRRDAEDAFTRPDSRPSVEVKRHQEPVELG